MYYKLQKIIARVVGVNYSRSILYIHNSFAILAYASDNIKVL